jgi:hypothetical protein
MKPKIILCLALVLSGVIINPIVGRSNDADVDDVRTTDIKISGLSEHLFFTEQPTRFTVQMIVASKRDDEKHTLPKVNELHRQVWLLRMDGTSIPQSQKPAVIGTGSGGFEDEYLIFVFQKESTNEVAGIVVSEDGKLYCQELKQN